MSPRTADQNDSLREESIKKIKAAALAVFAEKGYHAATIRHISEASGLSYGLVYHYFPSKADMFRSLVDFAIESTVASTRMLLGIPGSAREKLEAYAAMLAASAFSGESAAYFLVMLQAMTEAKEIPGLKESVERRTETYFEALGPVIADAQREGFAMEGDPRSLAGAFFACLQGMALFGFHKKGVEGHFTAAMLLNVVRKA